MTELFGKRLKIYLQTENSIYNIFALLKGKRLSYATYLDGIDKIIGTFINSI